MKLNKKYKLVISCDGGAASGKSTGAKLIAKKYNMNFLSSGLLYRYASFLILKFHPKNKYKFLKKAFAKLNLRKLEKINLHTQEISEHTSIIAKMNELRKILKSYQVRFAKQKQRCIIEGRDISTKVLPNSDIKFYFRCSLDVASKRRFKELKKEGSKITLYEVKKTLKVRNIRDKSRKHSPLLKHRDALEIDTGKMSISKMVKKMSSIIDEKIKIKYGDRARN
jgi:cytidylate kinase